MAANFLAHATPLGSGPAVVLSSSSSHAFKGDAPTAALPLPPRTRPAHVAIVVGQWHAHLVEPYCARVKAALDALDATVVVSVHASVGVGEIPLTVRRLLDTKGPAAVVDAVICLGVLLKGATMHMETTSMAAAVALAQLQVERDVVILNGIVAAFTPEDAAERTTGGKCAAAYLARAALHLATQ